MSSIKPNRNELLDAIVSKIASMTDEAWHKISDLQHKVKRKLETLRSSREEKQLKTERFEPSRVNMEVELNKLLKKHGFKETSVVIVARVLSDASPDVKLELRFSNAQGKSYTKAPTKILDRKIEDVKKEYEELEEEKCEVGKKNKFFTRNRYESAGDQKKRREAVIAQMLETDESLIDSIDKAVKSMTTDEDAIVAAAVLRQTKKQTTEG